MTNGQRRTAGWTAVIAMVALTIAVPVLASETAGEGHSGPSSPFAGNKVIDSIVAIVIFALLVVILGRFAWRPLLRALQDRERFIEESLAKARADREASEARLAEHTERLNRARQEATAIVEEGRRDAEVVQRRIQAEARSEAEALLERARREIGIARDTAVRNLYDLAAEMAVEVAGRIVRRELTPADHRQLIESAIAEFREKHGGNGEAG